ncbi:MAG: Rpp14/Pop5 family protein [Candidatus Micrarchaeaceae archaeon]
MITKQKSRYVLLEVLGEAEESFILSSLKSILGEVGMALMYPRMIRLYDNFFVVKVNRNYEDMLILSLSLLRYADKGNGKIGIYTIYTSGTMKKIKERLKEVMDGKAYKNVQ